MPHFKSADFRFAHTVTYSYNSHALLHLAFAPRRFGVSLYPWYWFRQGAKRHHRITAKTTLEHRWRSLITSWMKPNFALGYFFQMSLHYSSKLHSIFHPFSSGIFFFAIFRHRKLSDEFMLRGAAIATFRDPSGNAKACVMGIGWNHWWKSVAVWSWTLKGSLLDTMHWQQLST